VQEFLEILEKYRVTHASLVPPIVIALAKHPLVNQFNLSLKRVGCGTHMRRDTARACACAHACRQS
jgi:acyl-CoA synthetase (AMP-forming)/AMP-acid ligase II